MKELQLQNMVIDAVRAAGGAAHKLSNRFLVGVCDLLVKLPNRPAALIEVKLDRFSAKTTLSHWYYPSVTVPQEKFLREYWAADMHCGVYLFVEHGKGIRSIRFQMIDFANFHINEPIQIAASYLPGSSEQDRFNAVVNDIRDLCT